MNIGTLNTRCTIQLKSVTEDPTYGTEIVEWVELGKRWCNVQDVLPSRSEKVSGALEVAASQTRLRLRYCSDVDITMRVVINRPNSTTYQIISGPAILGDKDGVEFMIEKVTS